MVATCSAIPSSWQRLLAAPRTPAVPSPIPASPPSHGRAVR